MGILNITDYRLGTNRSRASTSAHRFFISLEGASQSGPATRAIIYFWPTRPVDTVGYVAGSLLVGMLDDSDFESWRDILRHEKPVRVSYVENNSDPQRRLHHISIGTTDEGVGEGPTDPNA
ncbi:hypothetical protein ACMA5I_14505 [Paracoccaceae bacterium GXU_MW_L88]